MGSSGSTTKYCKSDGSFHSGQNACYDRKEKIWAIRVEPQVKFQAVRESCAKSGSSQCAQKAFVVSNPTPSTNNNIFSNANAHALLTVDIKNNLRNKLQRFQGGRLKVDTNQPIQKQVMHELINTGLVNNYRLNRQGQHCALPDILRDTIFAHQRCTVGNLTSIHELVQKNPETFHAELQEYMFELMGKRKNTQFLPFHLQGEKRTALVLYSSEMYNYPHNIEEKSLCAGYDVVYKEVKNLENIEHEIFLDSHLRGTDTLIISAHGNDENIYLSDDVLHASYLPQNFHLIKNTIVLSVCNVGHFLPQRVWQLSNAKVIYSTEAVHFHYYANDKIELHTDSGQFHELR